MAELKECQYDDVIATLYGAKEFFINAEDFENFDIAIKIIESAKHRRPAPENKPIETPRCDN